MSKAANSSRYSPAIAARYRDNFARHVMGVSLYLQTEIMHALAHDHGHTRLRINFEPYITLAGSDGARLSDIADLLGISRQAANQTANQIVKAGYLERSTDPSDGRAKLLRVTPQAHSLMLQGRAEAERLGLQMEGFVGKQRLSRAAKLVAQLNAALGLLTPPGTENPAPAAIQLAAQLPRLADYINIRLMELTQDKGHPDLKPSFGQILTAIGPEGGRIQQIAAYQDVSKQAISAVASELEQLGYIERHPDPRDARQLVLQFSAGGEQLIADSVASVEQLLQHFSAQLGADALAQLEKILQSIYRGWQLEEDVFGNGSKDAADIPTLARQLRSQLGASGARTLAEMLLAEDT